jgi:hypothetical protein
LHALARYLPGITRGGFPIPARTQQWHSAAFRKDFVNRCARDLETVSTIQFTLDPPGTKSATTQCQNPIPFTFTDSRNR